MYAIIEDSGSQIKVSEGDVVHVAVRDLPEDAASITFDRVLMVSDEKGADGEGTSGVKIGDPLVKGASVTADVVAETRSARVPVVKFKRRKTYLRRKSHRQDLLKVKITSIKS